MIPVYKPYLNEAILKMAHEALDSTWISSKGKHIPDVEKELANIHSVGDVKINSALACCNGTAATHLVAKLLKKVHPNIKKIIVPNNVFIAAWNAFIYDKDFELEAVDADLETWNIDRTKLYEKLEDSNLEETAFLAVHNIGNILNVPQIQRDWKDLIIVEDNCEGFLGEYENVKSGTLSFASSISFFGNKTLTSGEGGAVIADASYQSILYKMRSQGQSDTRFIHDELGYNYRMTNVQAAILKGQLEHVDKIQSMKKRIFSLYKKMLSDIEEISFQITEPNTYFSHWMFGIRIKGGDYTDMESVFNTNFIDVRPMFYPINSHKHLSDVPVYGGSDVAKLLNKECVMLPSYPELKDHEICHIVNTVKNYISKNINGAI